MTGPPDAEAAAARMLAAAEEWMARQVGRTREQILRAFQAGSVRWDHSWEPRSAVPGDSPGELVMRREPGPGGGSDVVTVLRADPVIWVAGPWLYLILYGHGFPGASLEPCPLLGGRPVSPGQVSAGPELLSGWLFRVRHFSGEVVYRVGRYLPRRDVYELSWPD